ncbi:Dabb family protein [Phytohabitans kaempferiae]|uniref:Dabb family protein n=1 Tax=Phytohabitans kaempferiae TaxID=1620943 RepID=A0ABV6MAM8_9ACTN
MFRHVALFRFHEAASMTRRTEFLAALARLPGQIPSIRQVSCGFDMGCQAGNRDAALILDFADQAGFDAYKAHPAHLALVRDHVRAVVAETVRVQYPLLPADSTLDGGHRRSEDESSL